MGKRYDPGVDLNDTLRAAYQAVRRHGSAVRKAHAYYLWRRLDTTSFVVASDGTVTRFDRVALLAELRIMMLRQGMPLGFVARFDRAL